MNTSNNQVKLIGNLGSDPDVRETSKGRKWVRLSLATNDSYQNQQGERITETQWHTVVAWGKQAEDVAENLRKGSRIALEGKLVHRSYEGKDGQKRYVSEVVMNAFEMLARKQEQENAPAEA
ncbi:MAG: single-stranded DNA-binding protein [Flavobacteriales bacterium]|nr:single-stranded DNA-binding protein [Flavobacteriales bacterium]